MYNLEYILLTSFEALGAYFKPKMTGLVNKAPWDVLQRVSGVRERNARGVGDAACLSGEATAISRRSA